MHPKEPGWNWALDYLFNWHLTDLRNQPENGHNAVSIRAWIEYWAGRLIEKGTLTEDDSKLFVVTGNSKFMSAAPNFRLKHWIIFPGKSKI